MSKFPTRRRAVRFFAASSRIAAITQGVLLEILKHEYVTIWLNDQTAPPMAALTRWLRPFLGSPTAEGYLKVLGGAYSVARPAPRLRGD
jgi:hypothetical protein